MSIPLIKNILIAIVFYLSQKTQIDASKHHIVESKGNQQKKESQKYTQAKINI